MTAAQRKTPTLGNGGSDNGGVYTDDINAEVVALWTVAATYLPTIGGTADAITATSDTALVVAITAYTRPMKFSFKPSANNTGATTINIDTVGVKSIKDQDGNALSADALVAGRLQHIEFDGTNFILDGASSSASADVGYGLNGGRLTLTSGTPVLTTAVTGQLILYWTPDVHNQIGLFDGVSAWALLSSAEKQIKFTDAQSGATHNGTKVIDNLTDTSQLVVGMKISGTNVGGGATIQSIDSATQVTATVNSTGSATNTITFKVPANTGVDITAKNVSSALALRMRLRAAINTPTATVKQDGVEVISSATDERVLGAVKTSNTDGQVDYALNGQYRYSIYNRYNARIIQHTEKFIASGTWYKPISMTGVGEIGVGGSSGGGRSSTNNSNGGNGGSTSFGALAVVAGGTGSTSTASAAGGAASAGDYNTPGGASGNAASANAPQGGYGAQPFGGMGGGGEGTGSGGGGGGCSLRTVAVATLGASETITIGAAGTPGTNTTPAAPGYAQCEEVCEV